MLKVTQFHSLLQSHYFPTHDPAKHEMGVKLLDLMLFKVTNSQLNNAKLYQQHKDTISSTVIRAANMSDIQHLCMCLGQLVKQSQYKCIPKLQSQLAGIVSLSKLSYSNLGKMNLNTTNNTVSNQKSIISRQDKLEFGNISVINKNMMQLNLADQDEQYYDDDEENVQTDDFDNQGNFEDQIFTKILNNSKHQIKMGASKQNISKSNISNVSSRKVLEPSTYIDPIDTEVYLQKQITSYPSQLNYAVQKLKLKIGDWQQDKLSQNEFVEKRTLTIPAVMNNKTKVDVPITGYAVAPNKKKAKDEASMQILRKLYTQFPNIMQKIRQLKSKECIKH